MKKTLLEITQSILSDMDSEDVNSISDSSEALQVANVVRDTFYNIVTNREVPEHKELLKLTAASNSEFPTHFRYGDSVTNIETVWYEASDGYYQEIKWKDPLDFLSLTDKSNGEDVQVVTDKNGGTKLRIRNTQNPSFYTSFDDNWIVMNSFDNTVDTTLQSSKVRAYGVVYPTFSVTDGFTPDLDEKMFPYLIAESKSVCMSLFKGGPDIKIEQAARRQSFRLQNEMLNTCQKPKRPNYGRR